MLLTFKEAASLIGHRSRSTVYRWLEDGWLEHAGYLRGKAGRWRIESDPDGLRPFKEWAAGVIGPQGPMRQGELAPPTPEPTPAPGPEDDDGPLGFWREYGRVADPDEPQLSDAEYWENVHAIVQGMMGELLDLTPKRLGDLAFHLREAMSDVDFGARWDAKQWACASLRSLLEYDEARDGSCPHSLPELQQLAAGGLLTDELQTAANSALEAYGLQTEEAQCATK
jgi:hypothetical protein